jgi:hypothetical protein
MAYRTLGAYSSGAGIIPSTFNNDNNAYDNIFHATGYTPSTTTTTPGPTPGQQVITTQDGTLFATGWLDSSSLAPWYKKWWVLALIAGGAFIGYRRFIAKK